MSLFSPLPDLTPRESHTLWFASSRRPIPSASLPDPQNTDPNQRHGTDPRPRTQLLEQTTLARIAAAEALAQRERTAIRNFGSGWLRPPGIPKSLYQMREEKREQEEHQEAMRREQLAQELAEAEADNMPEDGTMDDVQLDGAQDLDDMIPDAEDFRGDDDVDEVQEVEDEFDDEEEEYDEDALRELRQNDLRTAIALSGTDDAYRAGLVHNDPDGDGLFGEEEELEEDEQAHMLGEEDFASGGLDGGDGDMDADLDNDIPEADEGDYEHTDSDAGLSSSSNSSHGNAGSEEQDQGHGNDDNDKGDDPDDDDDGDDEASLPEDIGFAPRRGAAPLRPPQSPTVRAQAANSGAGRRLTEEMDLSNLLSQDESSFMQSSPARGRLARQL